MKQLGFSSHKVRHGRSRPALIGAVIIGILLELVRSVAGEAREPRASKLLFPLADFLEMVGL